MENSTSPVLQSSFSEALQSSLLAAWPSLLLDSLLLFLLLCAVIYAVRLSRAVHSIHRGKAEIAWLFARFADNISKAEGLLDGMKKYAIETQERHERNKENAKRLESDLTYLIEKGNSLADHLEASISSNRRGIVSSSLPRTGASTIASSNARVRNDVSGGEPTMANKASYADDKHKLTGANAGNGSTLPSLQNLR